MLVVVMENRLVSPCQVCQTCLMASRDGQPRWDRGQLRCGRPVDPRSDLPGDRYQCQMGFLIAKVD